MPVPTRCPECDRDLSISHTGMGGPGNRTTVECTNCAYHEVFD